MRLTDQAVIAHLAANDDDVKIRMQALRKLKDQVVIANIAKNDKKVKIRMQALNKLKDQSVIAHIAMLDEDGGIRLQALKKLKDQTVIAFIAKNDKKAKIRMVALNKLKEQSNALTAASGEKTKKPGINLFGIFRKKPDIGEKGKDAKKRGKDNPVIAESEKFIIELQEQQNRISQPAINAKIGLLVDIMQRIIEIIKKEQESIPQIKNFINYYVPTTIKLLNDYDDLLKIKTSGGNVGETIKRIENILDALYIAYQHQLDSLVEHRTLDIRTDIAVIEKMMKFDGMTKG